MKNYFSVRTIGAFLSIWLLIFPQAYAKKKKTVSEPAKSKYEKLLNDDPQRLVSKGVLNLYWIKDKVYLEIPQKLLGRQFLMGTVVDRVSNPLESSVGFQPKSPMPVSFTRCDSLIRLEKITDKPQTTDYRIQDALNHNFNNPILKQFAVKAYSPDSAVVIDITSYVLNNDPFMNPIDPQGYNSMDGWVSRKSDYKSKQSMIASIAAFEDNVSIGCAMTYELSMSLLGLYGIAQNIPFTATVKRSFLLLPEDGCYPMRQADARVGTLWSQKLQYGKEEQGSRKRYWVNRWNLKADQPIVFYVDTLLPDSWKQSVYRSASIWNKAFERIGYPQAIVLKPYSNNSSTFDANNTANSCIRYVVSPAGVITDNCWNNPLTGEIISANIFIPHNVSNQIQLDYFLKTAAFNPKARTLIPDEAMVQEGLTSTLLRHFGHVLGLRDNMAASKAYPVDSLQSPSFVQTHGISASVMDILPFNYLLTSETYCEGMPLTQQQLGEYDYWAIRYLYQPTGKDPEAEKPILEQWAQERNQHPLLFFKGPQNRKAYYDPRGMAKDLSNNVRQAASIAFKNLSFVVAHANQWLDQEDPDYTERTTLYSHLINEADEYVIHVLQQVGGIYLNDIYGQDSLPSFQVVKKEQQREAFLWMLDEIEKMTWLDEKELLNHGTLMASASDYAQKFFGNLVLIQLNNMWLAESKTDDPYPLAQATEDLIQFLFKENLEGKMPSNFKRYMQRQFLDVVISFSDVKAFNGMSADNKSSKSLFINSLHPNAKMGVNPMLLMADRKAAMAPIESIDYQMAPEMASFWYGCLLELKSKFTQAKARAYKPVLRDEANYCLYSIDKAMRK